MFYNSASRTALSCSACPGCVWILAAGCRVAQLRGVAPVVGVTYQYYTGAVQWPFGYGLSYTTWQLDWLWGEDITIDASLWSMGLVDGPAWGVNVTNTGTVTSSVSVMAFLSSGAPGQPQQELFDFQRASSVSPGQSVTLTFNLPADVAATVDERGEVALVGGRQRVAVTMTGQQDVHGQGGGRTVLEGSVDVVLSSGQNKVVLQRSPHDIWPEH